MKRSARWLVTLVVVGGLMAGSLIPGAAAEPDEVDLRRLALENRVAQTIADLRLTPEQKAQLIEVAISYRTAIKDVTAELADLLAKRRDALLAGEHEAVDEVDKALRDLASRSPLKSDESAAEFIGGLTERQRQVLAQVLPGLGHQGPRVHAREWPGSHRLPRLPEIRRQMPRLEPMPLPELPRRVAPNALYVMPGWNLDVVDVLIDLLGR